MEGSTIMIVESSFPSVTILAGGTGPERQVSLNSGRCLADALEHEFRVNLIDLKDTVLPPELSSDDTIVISVIHGTFGEDGRLQDLLDEKSFYYAGSRAQSSRLCMDKSAAKTCVESEGVRVSQDICFQNPNVIDVEKVCAELGTEMILKPTDQGSSVALYVISGEDELRKSLQGIQHGNWMLEKRIFGREVTLGILNGVSMGIVEVIPQGGVYDYKRKYSEGSTEYRFPAVFDMEIEEEIKKLAKRAYFACDCRDFARIDFMVCEDGNPYFLEVNTLPGLTTTSLLPKSASCAGYDFQSLARKLIEPALKRFEESKLAKVTF
jgi:D-alanine-D-alanine ligase